MVDISVVILSKNEEEYIGATLDMVFSQCIDKRYEVIVIDSGSKDSTLKIAGRYPAKISQIAPEGFNHGGTRNKGAQMARGRIVVFLNADATPVNNSWLKGLVDYFSDDERISGVYSRACPRPGCNPLRSWEIAREFDSGREVRSVDDPVNYSRMSPQEKRRFLAFHTISCAIRRDILLEFPFRNMEFGEDLEWSKRVMEKGFKIAFEPKSVVLHSHNFYSSIVSTFKKYSEDAKLNNSLLGIWGWRDLPVLAPHMAYKVLKDASCILRLKKENFLYKIKWLLYAPFVRMAELSGIIAGASSIKRDNLNA
jgi:rhamnosyltransferase